MCPLSNDDGGAGRRPRKRPTSRAIEGQVRPGTVGFDSFETARFPFTGAPVECFKFVQGATTYRLTSADAPVTLSQVDSGTYAPDVLVRTELDFSQEDAAQNIEIGVANTNAVAQLWRAGTPTGIVLVNVFRKHRGDPEEKIIFGGRVVACIFEGAQAKLICAPLANIFQRKVPSILYQSQCNWSLYSSGCAVAKAGFKTTGTLLTAGTDISATAWGAFPDGWFTNGWAEIAATGERRFIVSHIGQVLTLMNQFASLAVGASVDAYAGCDRTESVCTAKFNNLVNHLGFPRIPTRNPYGGGSLV